MSGNTTIVNGNFLRGRGGPRNILQKTSDKTLEFVRPVPKIGRTVTVSDNPKSDADFRSIGLAIKKLGAAINLMKCIIVYPGTYNESIVPLAGQKILGVGKVIINGKLTVNTGCSLENLIIQNNNATNLPCLTVGQTVASNFDIEIHNCCFNRTMNNSTFTNLNLVEVNTVLDDIKFSCCKFISVVGPNTTDTTAIATQESITLLIKDDTDKPVYVSKCNFDHDQDDTLELQYQCIRVDDDTCAHVKCCCFQLKYTDPGANEIFACLSVENGTAENISSIYSSENFIDIDSKGENENCSVYRISDTDSRIFSFCDSIDIDESECDIKSEPSLDPTTGPVIHIVHISINKLTLQNILTSIDGVEVLDGDLNLVNFDILFDWYIVEEVETANNSIVLPLGEKNRDTKFVRITNKAGGNALDVDKVMVGGVAGTVTLADNESGEFIYSGYNNLWIQV